MPLTHEQWTDPNGYRFQHVPDKHQGQRRHCVDGKCRAYADGYLKGIVDALKLEGIVKP